MVLKNIVKHFSVVVRHKWVVFKLCCRMGEPIRGLLHDMSKFSPTEFFESVKYFAGTHSPILEAKKDKGYSEAWLHHKGRNKHHPEYWIDTSIPNFFPKIPYRYIVEMLCDKTAAGIIYAGKNWDKSLELEYHLKERQQIKFDKRLDQLLIEFFTKLSEEGIEKTFKKQYAKELYKKHFG